ncbi:glycosyltransferase [Bradyrhizobium sp. BRP22]|uniref:glycosyltransferase n=1 Tax=Bradyrhizobium sp. BRP22 TaxID=2793821 RepID=UPI001CD1BE93|nr:glycosyltransferase [Bradyrhizobium sp. BRP22]
MLKRVGIQEIFLPKKIPSDPSFRSGSVDWSEDEKLTIPKEDLAILNAADWYDDPGVDAWRIANKHFHLLFFIVLKARFFRSMVRHFDGAKVWRTYGLLGRQQSYGRILSMLEWREGPILSPRAAKSVWFGQAYNHLAEIEPPWLAERAIYLPAGLQDTNIRDDWTGRDRRILFVCPDLGLSEYYREIYRRFEQTFGGLPYAVAGAQPIRIQDDHVLGYVSSEEHLQNLRSFAVMYYHSSEPNHVHYHPFEAVRAGMPLVFMGGGLLDRLGGLGLPGRCKTSEEARRKIERILAGDKQLIGQIRASQAVLLDTMNVEHCAPRWRSAIELILKRTEERSTAPIIRKKRIAVILPVAYRGGSLRGAKLLASAVAIGSQQFGSPVDVIFGHLDDPTSYPDREFDDLPGHIERRAYQWRTLSQGEALRACAYAGGEGTLTHATYAVPDDGINQFFDCDLWIFVSDRLQFPVLPVRPHLLMIYDYLQRYVPIMDEKANQQLIDRAHAAEAVLVTTEFTANDARQFAGLPASKVRKVPLLVPTFGSGDSLTRGGGPPSSAYFIWTTNLAPHKNHRNALEALRIYYEEYDGRFECHVTGVDTDKLFARNSPHLVAAREVYSASRAVKANLKMEGDLPDSIYRRKLRDAAFLWHPGLIDNGTFSVVEAASFGVPALSSNYPAMREIDRQFELGLIWSEAVDPVDMAGKLKQMETVQHSTPRPEAFARHCLDRSAGAYWQVIQEFV